MDGPTTPVDDGRTWYRHSVESDGTSESTAEITVESTVGFDLLLVEIASRSDLIGSVELLAGEPEDEETRGRFREAVRSRCPSADRNVAPEPDADLAIGSLADCLRRCAETDVLAVASLYLPEGRTSRVRFERSGKRPFLIKLAPTSLPEERTVFVEVDDIRFADVAEVERPSGRITSAISLRVDQIGVLGGLISEQSLGPRAMHGSTSIYCFVCPVAAPRTRS